MPSSETDRREYEPALELGGQRIELRLHPNGTLEFFAARGRSRRRIRSFAVPEPEAYLPLRVRFANGTYRIEPEGSPASPVVVCDAESAAVRVEDGAGTPVLEFLAPLLRRALVPRDDGAAGGADGADAERSPAARAVEHRRAVRRDGLTLRVKSSEDACFYGLGERIGALDKRGRTYQMWNSDEPFQRGITDPLYQSIPFLLHARDERCDGILVDFTGRSWFDVADSDPASVSITVEDDAVSFFVIPGPEMASAVQRYCALTGKIPLPPLWALGYHQSRYSYYPDRRLLEVAREFRRRRIPCDALYLDIHYMDGYRVFTWDPTRFPDPEGTLEALREMGLRTVTIVDPGVKVDSEYETFTEGMRQDVFARRADGSVYRGAVWPGEAAFPDFTRYEVRRFWADRHAALLGRGVDGIWNDMNEPADFTGDFFDRTRFTPPEDVVLDGDGRPRSIDHYHNVYGNLMCRATADAFARFKPEQRPFILTRAGYCGVQRIAAVWTGDNDSSWDHLAVSIPMLLNMGLSGIALVGADVGGFQGNAEPELVARWMQAACLTPFMRGHTAVGTKDHEPWAFGPRVERIAREAIRLRYSLLPYLYAAVVDSHRTGVPVMRPLILEYAQDARCRRLWDQFLCGDALLVAPVLQPAQERRLVYLPEGAWYRLESDQRHAGPGDTIVETPLECLPVFARAGAVLARRSVPQSTAEPVGEVLDLQLYAGLPGTESRTTVFDDDGLTYAHYDGAYRETVLETRSEERAVVLRITPVRTGFEPEYRSYRVLLYGITPGAQAAGVRAELRAGSVSETDDEAGGAEAGGWNASENPARALEVRGSAERPHVFVPVADGVQELRLSW